MADQKIEFRKIRDFGENLNDTFLFIRQNFKPLLQSFFAICGVVMLAQAVFNGLYQTRFAGMWKGIANGQRVNPMNFGEVFNFQYFMVIILALVTFIAMQVALAAYIKYYVQSNGLQPGIEEVWAIFKKYYFRILIYSIPIGLMIILGTFFCLLPGIYLWVVFVPFTMVAMIEDTGFSQTYSRCFELVKQHFWISLGLYIVAYIIYYICLSLVGLVVTGIIGLITYTTTKDLGTTLGLVTSSLNIFSFSFYVIFFISVALHYFNLAEIKDGTGVLNRLDTMGGNPKDINSIDEEY